MFLNGVQAVELDGELQFIARTVDDPVLLTWVERLITLLHRPTQGASKDTVGIEFPSPRIRIAATRNLSLCLPD